MWLVDAIKQQRDFWVWFQWICDLRPIIPVVALDLVTSM